MQEYFCTKFVFVGLSVVPQSDGVTIQSIDKSVRRTSRLSSLSQAFLYCLRIPALTCTPKNHTKVHMTFSLWSVTLNFDGILEVI